MVIIGETNRLTLRERAIENERETIYINTYKERDRETLREV
jgi:hypothetical protein